MARIINRPYCYLRNVIKAFTKFSLKHFNFEVLNQENLHTSYLHNMNPSACFGHHARTKKYNFVTSEVEASNIDKKSEHGINLE